MPRVSVIIPLYNHEKYIYKAIISVLNQKFSDFELLIINDGSTDESEEVVKDIKDDRIKYFYQENKGAHNTINRGILLSESEYISILNSDDMYHPDRLSESLKMIESNDQINAVFSEVEFIDKDDNLLHIIKAPDSYCKDFFLDDSFQGEKETFFKLLMGNFLVSTSNLFCHRKVFDKIGYFSNFKYAHDYEFFLRLSYNCKVFYIQYPLLKFRIHDTSTFKNNEAETQFEVGIILKELILKHLIHHGDKERKINNLIALFNHLNTSNTDRMIMFLLLINMTLPDTAQTINEDMIENPNNSLRLSFIERLKVQLDLWKYSQEAWNKWEEANKLLAKTYNELHSKENELTAANEKNLALQNELTAANEKNLALQNELNNITAIYNVTINSYSYRIGRLITLPIRKSINFIKK